jgi:predicted extracellular nuclease
VRDVTGVLDQRHGAWRLQLDAALHPTAAPRPQAPRVVGDLRIASLNLENLFNGDGRGGGFPTPRGARTPAELKLQVDKLVATLHALDPDIAALMELENDGYGRESSLAQLAAALGPDWRFVDAGQGPGPDEIRVGLVYRASRIAAVGAPATLVAGPFGTRSRAPLAQAFKPLRGGTDDGPVFIVVANHFKSKGCAEASGADLDQHDGQACWNALRTTSADQLDAWLRRDPTRFGSDLSLIIGDLNAYAHEDPVRTLLASGWVDALKAANVVDPYSYVFDSQAGRLDHALLSPALARRLSGAAEWHVNADEPASSGYRAGGAGPWGSSDHDPLLLGFTLRGARDPGVTPARDR